MILTKFTNTSVYMYLIFLFPLSDGVLTISRPVINGTQVIGVLHAELPWQQLFSVALTRLAERKSSYPFVFDYSNQLLFHPLLPSNVLGDVPVTEPESEAMGRADVSALNSTRWGKIVQKMLKSYGRESTVFFIRQCWFMYMYVIDETECFMKYTGTSIRAKPRGQFSCIPRGFLML